MDSNLKPTGTPGQASPWIELPAQLAAQQIEFKHGLQRVPSAVSVRLRARRGLGNGIFAGMELDFYSLICGCDNAPRSAGAVWITADKVLVNIELGIVDVRLPDFTASNSYNFPADQWEVVVRVMV
jgi:hypothetical protein